MPGALRLAGELLQLLRARGQTGGPASLPGTECPLPPSLESLLPPPAPPSLLERVGGAVGGLGSALLSPRRSPLVNLLLSPQWAEQGGQEEIQDVQHATTHFLRGWLSVEETRELLTQAGEAEVERIRQSE